MKKGFLLVATLVLTLSLCACGANNKDNADALVTTPTEATTPAETNPVQTEPVTNPTETTPAQTEPAQTEPATKPTETTPSKEETPAETTHTHSWKAATCTTPKTCSTCNATEGKAADHNWKAATCTTPKTCSTCKATEGKAADHDWKAATCTTAKICSVCNTTEGAANGHSWKDATCTTPKTCAVCSQTEGEVLEHNNEEFSLSNGYNVGSIITYQCKNCKEQTTKKIEELKISATLRPGVTINGYYQSVYCDVTATGGYGTYQYKYEVYTSSTSTKPALTEDFSSSTSFGWKSAIACNGHVLKITVKDEAGNEIIASYVAENIDPDFSDFFG